MKRFTTLLKAFFILICMPVVGCNNQYSAQGTVQKTEQGRDRYMLFMKSGNTVHRVIVSRPDMGADFKNVSPGDSVKVTAKDTVHWQAEVHMRATSIKILGN